MQTLDWENLVKRFIADGERPELADVWDTEEPETYLQRLYEDANQPAELRQLLITTLQRELQERNRAALNRGLRLAVLIPHTDFADVLQEIFFTVRSGGDAHLEDVALLALRAMQSIQSQLGTRDPLRPVWQAMWLALLGNSRFGSGDPKFGIAAYQGLRQLGASVALHHLPLLLRRIDLNGEDLKIILRGLKRDSDRESVDLVESVAEAIISLNAEERANHISSLREAFGDDVIDKAIRRSQAELEVRLAQDSDLVSLSDSSDRPHLADQSPLRYLHDRLFPNLALWLRERIPVHGVSIWLVDDSEEAVHFRGQSGCPGIEPFPPRIMRYGEYASGRVAQSRKSDFFDLTDEQGPKVYMREEFLSVGVSGLYSVYAEGGKQSEPSLAIVVNYFDESQERLRRLADECSENAELVARVSQRVFAKYKNAWVAHLADRLSEKPMLDEATSALVKDISKAIPLCDRIAVYLFDPELRELFLHTLHVPETSQYPSKSAFSRRLGVRLSNCLTGGVARRSEPRRISHLTQWGEAHDCVDDIQERLKELALDNLPDSQNLNYMGVAFREPAPVGFTGMLGGVVEVYRSVETNSAKAFTPVGEHIVKELSNSATPFILRAFNFERRFSRNTTQQLTLQTSDAANQLTRELDEADLSLRKDLQQLVEGWQMSREANKTFFAFRTLRDRCKAFWPSDAPQVRFDEVEKAARSELQLRILTHEDLFQVPGVACHINLDFLSKLEVSNCHKERLSELGLVLIPLVDRSQLSGILGLEFGSSVKAIKAAEEINRADVDTGADYVRNSMMQTWIEHRRHLRALFAASLEHLSNEAVKTGRLPNTEDLFNFVAGGNVDLDANERTYGELTATALRRVPSDAKCLLKQECQSWQSFSVGLGGKFDADIEPVELMAVPSAVRMILASSTAPVLWGEKASISLDKAREAGWCHVRITSHKNGHEELRREGLSLTKGIADYRGWDCSYEDEETLCVALPAIPT